MTERLGEQEAEKAAGVLMSQFPSLRRDTDPTVVKSMFTCIVTVFVGKPVEQIKRALHPESGIAAKTEFLSLKSVNDWLGANPPRTEVAPRLRVGASKHDDLELPPEERARRVRILRTRIKELHAMPTQLNLGLAKVAQRIIDRLQPPEGPPGGEGAPR